MDDVMFDTPTDEEEPWWPCCEHCGCDVRQGHDETCIYGCNKNDTGKRPEPVPYNPADDMVVYW